VVIDVELSRKGYSFISTTATERKLESLDAHHQLPNHIKLVVKTKIIIIIIIFR
jgi:hypothetical protein